MKTESNVTLADCLSVQVREGQFFADLRMHAAVAGKTWTSPIGQTSSDEGVRRELEVNRAQSRQIIADTINARREL